MAEDKVESIKPGQAITARWLNRLVSKVNAIPRPKQVDPQKPDGEATTEAATAVTDTYWTVTSLTTEEVEIQSEDESCTVTVTRVTGFTATDGSGNTMTISGFDVE